MADTVNARSKSRCYLGSACIYLDHLSFEDPPVRDLDEKNVDRLFNIFKIEGCKRYERMNHVLVLIEHHDLKRTLRANNISSTQIKREDPPFIKLSDNFSLVCLHGRHRLAAAKLFLKPREQWWVVDVFRADGQNLV